LSVDGEKIVFWWQNG